MSSMVLAYSGGLDTSVILRWLITRGHTIHAAYVDVGQPRDDLRVIEEKARRCGAASFHICDAREVLVSEFAFPALQMQARYEGVYLMGTSIARPIIARECLRIARETSATVFAHGATGKGNDQCRFQLAANALSPSIEVFAPWRDRAFREEFPGRREMIAFAEKEGIPTPATAKAPYSTDENVLHVSYEAGILEDLSIEGIPQVALAMCVLPENAPPDGATVTIRFDEGVPVAVNGESLSPLQVVQELNAIGGAHGIGLIDMVENRFIGMKSRAVYEAPGMTLLYEAHRLIEQLAMDRDLMRLRDRLMPEFSELVYNGFWYSRKMAAMLAFNREAQRHVSGEATLRLRQGTIRPVSRTSPYSLYREAIATMEGGGTFDQSDSEGFLRIMGLPLRVQAELNHGT